MSMIPANLSAIPSSAVRSTTMVAGEAKRLPRALGWLLAAAFSGSVWCMAIEAIRLVF